MFSRGTSRPGLRRPRGITLTLGKSLSIRGDIFGKEDLVIDGTIEGSVHISDHHLTVAGTVEGNVSARQVTVLGRVRGNVVASELVELRETATVEGDVYARRFCIEENATLNGRIQTHRDDRKLGLVQGQPPTAPPRPKVIHVRV